MTLKDQIRLILGKYPETHNNDRLFDYYFLKDIYGVTLPNIYLKLPSAKQIDYIKKKILKEEEQHIVFGSQIQNKGGDN